MQKMTFQSTEALFEAFNSLKVLVIGDIMLDSYLWGKVERISPEAPVPVVNVQKREIRLGGAANVALNVQALGAKPTLFSIVGDDKDGDIVFDLLNDHALENNGILRSSKRITTIKHRVISGSHHLLRVDQETDKEITKEEQEALLQLILAKIDAFDVIIFEDYDKGVLTKYLIESVIEEANKRSIPTIVDPKKRNFLLYKGATLFKPNKKELIEGLKLDHELQNTLEIEQSVLLLKNTLQLSAVLITLSEKGVYLHKDDEKIHLPAYLRKISDVSGAGDTVVGTAALCMALGISADSIAKLSNLAGGLVCEHIGVVPIEKIKLFEEAKKEKIF